MLVEIGAIWNSRVSAQTRPTSNSTAWLNPP